LGQPTPAELQGIPDERIPAVLATLQRLQQLLPPGGKYRVPMCGEVPKARDLYPPGLDLGEALHEISRITDRPGPHAFAIGFDWINDWINVPSDLPATLEQLCVYKGTED
jgi:hypothetical protein